LDDSNLITQIGEEWVLYIFRLSRLSSDILSSKLRWYYPGRAVRPGNGRFRVIPLILWKQYSGRKFSGFFFRWFSAGFCRIRQLESSSWELTERFDCYIKWMRYNRMTLKTIHD
jgi:hypothetical protein